MYTGRKEGISRPKNLLHLWQYTFVSEKNPSKNHQNPFIPKKSRTLFRMSEMSLRLEYSSVSHIRNANLRDIDPDCKNNTPTLYKTGSGLDKTCFLLEKLC